MILKKMNEDTNSDRQWMWINKHNQYKICAKTTSANMKIQTW